MKKILLTAIVIVITVYFGNAIISSVSAESMEIINDLPELPGTHDCNNHHDDDIAIESDIEWFDVDIDNELDNELDMESDIDDEMVLCSAYYNNAESCNEIAINGKIFNVISQETDITGNEIYICDNAVITVNYKTNHVAVTDEQGDAEIMDISELVNL